MFSKLLIANRGEVACRIIKTAKKLGIQSVAIYSSADKASLHTKQADEAYCVGPAPSAQSYLNQKAIIQAALAAGCDAIHPGYGFLSENADFAKAVQAAGIVWIGPPVKALDLMGSKQKAKQLLEKTNVPLTPGYHGKEQSAEVLLSKAKEIGFPVLLKAASGGGGKGMRAVRKEQDFKSHLESAQREAQSSFGDNTMLIEKLIQNPRHVELQILADNHGKVIHLFDRDCSIQRRHQKIIEEAPAPNLSQTLKDKMAEAAITVAQSIHYQGAGTIEFLVEDNRAFYFMEMNTRLQVEHPVTEMITGIDLVEWQIKVAAGCPLNEALLNLKPQGHAIECRIYAEDSQNNFLPSTGTLSFLKEPKGDGIRIDTGVQQNDAVTVHYDPMIAKLITYGKDRKSAIARMQSALLHYHIGGLKTNRVFLQSIIQHPSFKDAKLTTHFLENETLSTTQVDVEGLVAEAACIDYLYRQAHQKEALFLDTLGFKMNQSHQWTQSYSFEDKTYSIDLNPLAEDRVSLLIGKTKKTYSLRKDQDKLYLEDGERIRSVYFQVNPSEITLYNAQGVFTLSKQSFNQANKQAAADASLQAPMPSTVIAVLKQPGDKIEAGETLVVLEAMKMEHSIQAPYGGTLTEIHCEVGSQVEEGKELLVLEPEKASSKEEIKLSSTA